MRIWGCACLALGRLETRAAVLWVAVLLVVSCKKEDPWTSALQRAEAAEAKGDVDTAIGAYMEAYNQGATAAGPKAYDLQMKQRQEAETRRTAQAKQEEAACTVAKWITWCEINGQPSGGMLSYKTKARCDEFVNGYHELGIPCAPCTCASDSMEGKLAPAARGLGDDPTRGLPGARLSVPRPGGPRALNHEAPAGQGYAERKGDATSSTV